MITHLKFAGIPTRDQDAAVAFYTEKLGFKVVTDQPHGAQRWIEMRVGASDTRVVLFTPDGHQDRVGTFFNGAFACDNVERTYEELSRKGVEFAGPPQKQPWGTFATFKDVDGNTFVLSSR
jgi:catechol 2,3-dioxygenase-like lactoylglutathione lyase family enzyme